MNDPRWKRYREDVRRKVGVHACVGVRASGTSMSTVNGCTKGFSFDWFLTISINDVTQH